VEDGAMVIDVNMDEGLLDGVAAMSKFLRIAATEPDVSKVPFMIDSSKFEIIEVGLQNVQVRAPRCPVLGVILGRCAVGAGCAVSCAVCRSGTLCRELCCVLCALRAPWMEHGTAAARGVATQLPISSRCLS
jgi:hypothetical protein